MTETAGDASVETRPAPGRILLWFVWAAVGLAFVVGVVLRLWYVTHQSTNSDNAIVGLMAQQILHGHFSAFYWGQDYGGVEPYVAAALFAVFGHSSVVLSLTPVLLSLVAALLTWRIVLRLQPSRLLALGSAAFVWVVPQVSLWDSTREMGFHEAQLVCGLTAILFSLRMLDGRLGPGQFAALGLAAGIGWWSSPEVVYFLVPAGSCLVGAIVVATRTSRPAAFWIGRAGALLGGFVCGALPWLWANAHSHLASLRAGAFQVPPGSPGYLGRLGNFFIASFPMQLNLREPQLGLWWHGTRVAGALTVVGAAVVLVLLAVAARQGGRNLAFVAAVAVFPFVEALVPGSWSWNDGRYTLAFGYLLVLAVAPGIAEVGRLARGRSRRPALTVSVLAVLFGLGVVGASLGSLHSFQQFRPFVDPGASFFSDWGNPDRATGPTLQALARSGVTNAYADYWAAYRLDFLSGNRVHVTTVPPDLDRWPADDRVVARTGRPAWIFVPLTATSVSQFQNASIVGPGGWTLEQFEQRLRALGIRYRVHRAGMVVAVVPDRRVTSLLGPPPAA